MLRIRARSVFFELAASQLSMTVNSPAKQNPVANRIASHTVLSTTRTSISVAADATAAKAANTRI
ncbi:hypothetical protein BMS3Bbin10_02051 [bacterium BMS3Bbin10]|nr:hypothetical protein BMS3Bbin10_02051 [bacterium BMS3Bbin10]